MILLCVRVTKIKLTEGFQTHILLNKKTIVLQLIGE